MEKVQIEDLYQFVFVSDAAFSPDGRHIAHLRHNADADKNDYRSALWVMDADGENAFLLAERGDVKSFLWLDDSTILFSSKRGAAQEAQKSVTNYYTIAITGGEASHFMSIPLKVEQLKPAGKNGFYVQASAPVKMHVDVSTNSAHSGKDYDIFEELPYWFNGKGIRDGIRTALFYFNSGENTLKQLTDPYLNVTAWAVSPSKKTFAYCGNDYRSVCPANSTLWLQPGLESAPKVLIDDTHYSIDDLCFMGEDTLFYTGTPTTRMGQNPRYYRYHIATDSIDTLPFYDVPIGNKVGSDAKYGSGKQMTYYASRLYMLHTLWGNTRLVAIDNDGCLHTVIDKAGAITGFDLHDSQILLTAMRENKLVEIYLADADTGSEKQLTDCNRVYFDTHQVQTPERFTYMSRSGCGMEGFVLPPADFNPESSYPAILSIHGGPKAAFGSVFFHEMQCLSAQGSFVFYTNPRGSDGRGEAFADITEAFGAKDYDDVMALTDEVLKRYPQIDAQRLGVGGGSYGGFLTNWIIGQTERFAAAVSQRSISNYLSKMLYTDIGYQLNRLQIGAYPWEDFEKVWGMSPLKYAHRVKTPTLLLQSDEDYRCWMGESFQMFSAIKRNGVQTRFVLFHGENHELSRSGKPHNRITRLQELVKWYANILKFS